MSSKATSTNSPSWFGPLVLGLGLLVMTRIIYWSYRIRMQAIDEYGLVIHEFDPYFNYRATEYLYEHGWRKFFSWFDYMVWYPLGRPVGTTIYPGMQFTAVAIKEFLFTNMSINDICCMIPAWFGGIATFLTGLIAYECSMPQNSVLTPFDLFADFVKHGKPSYPNPSPQNWTNLLHTSFISFSSPALECSLIAMGIMSVIPAHLMRSIGGGYDNESVAMTAMTLTFYCWVRSLRSGNSLTTVIAYGIASGFAYFYMVAAWGGYIFVLNMVGLHAALLVAMGRFSTNVYIAYSLFYAIGTFLAIHIPVVGWAPLKSLEQLAPCALFLGYQALQATEIFRKRKKLSRADTWKLRIMVGIAGLVAVMFYVSFVAPSGYFGPLSSRVRGLFVRHTKTGNPLVDSVAEHQPASNKAYFQYLHHICLLAPVGYLLTMFHLSDASSFLLAWGGVTYFFSSKMVRLILLLAPIGSILGGIAAGRMLRWSIRQLWDASTGDDNGTENKKPNKKKSKKIPNKEPNNDITNAKTSNGAAGKGPKRGRKVKNKTTVETEEEYAILESVVNENDSSSSSSNNPFEPINQAVSKIMNQTTEGIMLKRSLAVLLLLAGYMFSYTFKDYSWRLSIELSHPSIIVPARTRTGQKIKVDDYREAYWWVRDNTPADARILAWWDYGYQITGIANRTTIADGNTWNHEHIALLGKVLTTDLQEGYEIARHLGDYALVWSGGGGDDLAKSPHLARIANSVYRDHCPDDPTCRAFGFLDRSGTPSPMMKRSFLYNLHGHNLRDGVKVSEDMFKEVFKSKYGKVRIFKIMNIDEESKRWVADPDNRVCDVPGSWFCPGQYPPGLRPFLMKGRDFAQLEDFNKKENDKQYQKEYFEALKDPVEARQNAMRRDVAAERLSREVDERKQRMNKIKQQGGDGNRRKSNMEDRRNSDDDDASRNVVINPDGSVSALPEEEDDNDDEVGGSPTTWTPPDPEAIEAVYGDWRDTEQTTALWTLIQEGRQGYNDLKEWLYREPILAFVRSKDGRGPMWWAYEARQLDIVKLLTKLGVPQTDADQYGNTPASLLQKHN